MEKKLLLAGTLAVLAISPALGQASMQRGEPGKPIKGPPPEEAIARLYNSISSSPVLPDEVSGAAAIRVRIPKPGPFPDRILEENLASEFADIKSDPCRNAEAARLCNIAGAETIRKIRNYSWGRAALKYPDASQLGLSDRVDADGQGSSLAVQMALLDYGIRKNMQKHYGERGASDEQEDRFNALWASADNPSSAAKLGDKAIRLYAGCKSDVKSINYGWLSLFPQHKLTTCHTHVSARVSLWIFSVEGAAGITNSRFARKVVLWVPNGASSISAITDIGSNIGNAPFVTTNANNWMATSGGARVALNKPPMTLAGQGAANELGSNFNLNLP